MALIEQKQNRGELGAAQLLNAYARQRQGDHDKTIGFTNNVVRIFSNDWLPVAALRNSGLTLLDHLPSAKQLLARHAMGLAGRLPKIGAG